MQKQQIPIIKGDRAGEATEWRDNLLQNMYGVPRAIQGAQAYIKSFYGLAEVAVGEGVDRGATWNERFNTHYRVSGSQLITVGVTGDINNLGHIAGITRASLPYSFNTQGIVSGGRFYLHNQENNILTEVLSPNLGEPIDGVWIDGYYVLTDGEYIYNTNIADETQIDPLAYATPEISPDPTLGLGRTQDNKLIVFGRYSTEYFQNIASEDFPFTRLTNRALKTGIVGTHCKVEMLGTWFILGGRKDESPTIQTLSIKGVDSIASREINKILSTYNEQQLATAVLESFEDDGTQFLLARLPSHTLLFNYTYAQKFGVDDAWSILTVNARFNEYMPIANGIFDPRVSRWVFGESDNNRIGILENTTCLYFGEEIEQIFYTPFIPIETASVDEIEIDTIAGMGSEKTTVFVATSYDAAHFGKEYTMLYGDTGTHNQRFIRHGFGYVRKSISFKFRAVTPSRLAFSKLMISYG